MMTCSCKSTTACECKIGINCFKFSEIRIFIYLCRTGRDELKKKNPRLLVVNKSICECFCILFLFITCNAPVIWRIVYEVAMTALQSTCFQMTFSGCINITGLIRLEEKVFVNRCCLKLAKK